MLREFQAEFADALIMPTAAQGRRAIYQGNVMNALAGVLAAAYPVCRAHVGATRFDAAARAFVRATPPRIPQLSAYGDGFAAFLDQAPNWQDMPYIGDVARLEWARVEAYFSADAEPLAPARLATIAEHRYPALRFTLHPTTRLVAARYPVSRVWAAPGESFGMAPADQRLLVVRPHHDVTHAVLSKGDGTLIRALADGEPLERAAERALRDEPGLDLQAVLAAHLQRGTFAAVQDGSA